jgi:hypothetical protein
MSKIAIATICSAVLFGGWLYLVTASGPAHAVPIAGDPQFRELIGGPCATFTFVAGDGGVTEGYLGVDAGSANTAFQVSKRWRVYSNTKVFIDYNRVAGADSIPIAADSPEEIEFSDPGSAPGTLYGQAAAGTATVSLCPIKTSNRSAR